MSQFITNKGMWRINSLYFGNLVFHAVLMKTTYNYDQDDDDNYAQIKTFEMDALSGYPAGGFQLNGVQISEEPGLSKVTFPSFQAFIVNTATFGPVRGIAIVEWSGVEATSYLVGYRNYLNPVYVGVGLPYFIPDLNIPLS